MRISPESARIAKIVLVVVALSAGVWWIQPASAHASFRPPRVARNIENQRNDAVLIAVGSLQVAGVILFEVITRKRRRSRTAQATSVG
jgi:hypothetical protein